MDALSKQTSNRVCGCASSTRRLDSRGISYVEADKQPMATHSPGLTRHRLQSLARGFGPNFIACPLNACASRSTGRANVWGPLLLSQCKRLSLHKQSERTGRHQACHGTGTRTGAAEPHRMRSTVTAAGRSIPSCIGVGAMLTAPTIDGSLVRQSLSNFEVLCVYPSSAL